MKMKFTSEEETRFGSGPESCATWARKGRSRAGLLFFLLGLNTMLFSAGAATLTITNSNALTTPDTGAASLYPSNVSFIGFPGTVTAVRVTLHNITHTFPDDYDILLVGPGGQKALLMSDCGGSTGLNNVTITISDAATALLPDATAITAGSYRSMNYGAAAGDAFPAPAPQAAAYSASLATFNNISPNGTWSLYVVDDATGDTGSIAGGWTLNLDTTTFESSTGITIPAGLGTSGPASPYPSQINVAGFSSPIKSLRVTLLDLTHTFPDDIDILLAGPGGNALIMSDVGGDQDVTNVTLVLDDAAANNLPDASPLVSGTFQPTNIGTGDTFPLPAPVPAGATALSTFNGTMPNGDWNLFVVDDASGDTGSILRWSLDFVFPPTILANISTRLRVETGDNVLIGGFIVTGTQPKRVIIRAIGPSLPLDGKLPDPTLELRDVNGVLLGFNDDWRNGAGGFPSQQAEIIATGVAPTNDLESAIVASLPANNASYTAIVRGFDNATGIALVEAYDLDRTVNSKLANISTRGLVQTDDNVLIAGTILLGATSQKVLLRALGPSLAVSGPLADPVLELYDGNGVLILANDDWQDSQAGEITATTIPPPSAKESAMVVTLPSGGASYTAIVRGQDGSTGVAVVEAYALN